jgi:hypothetical protein
MKTQYQNPKAIIASLINQTISNVTSNSPIVSEIEDTLSNAFVQKHYNQLSKELISEINFDVKKQLNTYVSLDNLSNDLKVEQFTIDDISAFVYKQKVRKNNHKKYLVNLVFPCRNSSKLIANSFQFLISEIKKSYNLDFNVIFQVNNTSDNTISVILDLITDYKNVLKNADFYIVETEPNLNFSLPGSLNLGYKFIREITYNIQEKYEELFYSFWDDELDNLIPTADSLFESNINVLLQKGTNKAISGYMIDNRLGVSRWHELSKGFSSDIRFIHSKPYLHGGSGTIMRLSDFPSEGIKSGGIADTDLAEHLLKQFTYEELDTLDFDSWPIRSNHNAPVFHPIETDIIGWTTKYLMYLIAWENTYDSLNMDGNNIGKLWKKRLDENRKTFHQSINKYLTVLSPEKVLDREFMHYYYTSIQSQNDKKELYSLFKQFRSRSYNLD